MELTSTFSKSTVIGNMFKVNNNDTRMTSLTSSDVSIDNFTYFTRYSSVSFIDFEQINVCQETVLWISIYPRVERRNCSTASIVNFEDIPHLVLAFLLLILSMDLSSNDNKRLQTFHKITSYPYGTNVCKVCKSEMLSKYKLLILRENLNWQYIPDNP